jgi:hypothetical protein
MIRFVLLLFSATIGLFAYSMDMHFLQEQANKACYLKPGEPDGSLDVSGLSVMERIGYAQQLHQSLDLATLQYGNPPAGQARQGQTSELPGPE